MISGLSENRILGQMKKGDAEAFTEIYDKYVDAIYRFVFFKVSSRQDAEDLTSQVFSKALEYCLKKDSKVSSLKAFLYCIARNTVTDFYRQKQRSEVSLNEEIKSDPEADVMWSSDQDMETRVGDSLEMRRVREALDLLKEEYRDVIILHYLDELSVREISDVMGKSGGAVRVLLHRAMKSLQGVMSRQENGAS